VSVPTIHGIFLALTVSNMKNGLLVTVVVKEKTAKLFSSLIR